MDPAAPGYAFTTGSLGLGIHGRRLRDLGPGFDPHAQLPSIDPDLDLMHLATLVLDSPLASSLATVIILYGGLRARGIDEVCDLSSTNAKLGQGSADAVQRHARLSSWGDRLARPEGWSLRFAAPAVWWHPAGTRRAAPAAH
jgi:hypothetical protein